MGAVDALAAEQRLDVAALRAGCRQANDPQLLGCGERSPLAALRHGLDRDAARATRSALRRGGLYSSHLTGLRKQLVLHGSEVLAGRKRGRKPKLDAKDRRIAELEQRAARLEAKLSIAEKLIDLQKKVSAILGINLATDGES